MPCLRRLVGGVALWRPGFNPKSVRARFVVDKVALGRFFWEHFLFPLLGPGYTRYWLPAYSFVSRARARRDTTRQDCFVVIPAHTGVTIVYCGIVVPSCSSQMSARWLSITSRNACEHSVNKSECDWLLGVLVLRWIALWNGSPGNCSGLCSCSSDTEE